MTDETEDTRRGKVLYLCGARHPKVIERTPPTYQGPAYVILACQGPADHKLAGLPEHIAVYGTAFITWRDD